MLKTPGYIALFILIQAASLVLAVIGLPICAILAWGGFSKVDSVTGLWHWPKAFWLWDNDEDGVYPYWYMHTNPNWSVARIEFTWAALRNSANNLRFVPGVSKPGRPLFYRTWLTGSRQFYAKAGWAPARGWPMLSLGAGRGY